MKLVKDLPTVSRSGSGRKNEVFDKNTLNTLKSTPNSWYMVQQSPWMDSEDKEKIRKTRLNYYMRGKYARENYGKLETAVRTETQVSNGQKLKSVTLYARSI
tara:strand:- start:2510 stop:2815 length:306 start_codon:yes stop_codon:yes gene_type:complete